MSRSVSQDAWRILGVRGTGACRREQVSVPRGRNSSRKLYRLIGALLFFLTRTLSLVGQSARGLTLGTVALHGSATVTRTQTTHTTRRIISTKLRGKSSWSMGEHLLLGGAITWMSACSAQPLRSSHIVGGMAVLSVEADGLGTIDLDLDLSTLTSWAYRFVR